MPNKLADFFKIIQTIGNNVAYAQGGGGNFSVKTSAGMYVKASGTRLSAVSENNGLVLVNNKNIINYFTENKFVCDEAVSANFINNNILERLGSETLRASIETGFHVYLNNYVIHTHSVYANSILCGVNAKEVVDKTFSQAPFKWQYIPFYTPGLFLTKAISGAINELGFIPDVLFLQNHGVIYTAESPEGVYSFHQQAEDILKRALNFPPFPTYNLKPMTDQNSWSSESAWWQDFFTKFGEVFDNLNNLVLFPDCAVYTQDNQNKIIFNKIKKSLIYKASADEAAAIEETLLAWSYVITMLKNQNREAEAIPQTAVNYILGMDMEKYRQSLLKK